MKISVSDHARQRYQERFPNITTKIEELLKDTIIFGGQRKSECLLLNHTHNIVFPICYDDINECYVVKTVLAYDQCMANLSMLKENRRMMVQTDPSLHARVKSFQQAAAAINPVETITIPYDYVIKLRALACEYVKRCEYIYPQREDIKRINKEVKEAVPVSVKQINKYFWKEFGEVIYEHNRKIGRFDV